MDYIRRGRRAAASRKAFIESRHHQSSREKWGLFMRMVIMLSFLALLAASVTAFGAAPVSVGGDFGQAWLKSLPYQPTTSSEDAGGLWSWGDTPSGYKVVNGTLAPEGNDNDEIDFDDIGWLGTESQGSPLRFNQSEGPVDFLSPFYSDDPWFLSQHYEIPILVPEDYYD